MFPTMKFKVLCAILSAMFCAAAEAANYYVNDSATAGDVYSAAPGALANSGMTSNAPKASLQDILTAYALAPGDTVFVDAGNYTNGPAAVIGPGDSGDMTLGTVLIKGAGSAKTLLVNTNVGAYGLHFSGAGYVRLEGVAVRGVVQGVRVENSSHIELANCDIANCGYGVIITGGSDNRVDNCVLHHNGHQALAGVQQPLGDPQRQPDLRPDRRLQGSPRH